MAGMAFGRASGFRRVSIAAALTLLVAAAPYASDAPIALGAPDHWDYLTFDAASQRVFVAHGDRLTAIDMRTRSVVGEVAVAGGAHGVAIVDGRGFAASGKDGRVVVFDSASLARQPDIKAAEDADAIVADPSSNRVFVVNGGSGSLTVIDPKRATAVASVQIGGDLEFGAADGAGRLFVNVADKRQIAVVDIASSSVVARWPVPSCVSPHGMAYDPVSHHVFTTCVDGHMIGIDAATGRQTSMSDIGRGSDAAAFDPRSRRLFSSNNDGTLDVFEVAADGTPRLLSHMPTAAGARTMALGLDGRVYLVTADADGPAASNGRFKFKPGSVKLLTYDPAS